MPSFEFCRPNWYVIFEDMIPNKNVMFYALPFMSGFTETFGFKSNSEILYYQTFSSIREVYDGIFELTRLDLKDIEKIIDTIKDLIRT